MNKHTPEQTSVTVTKAWDDADNQDGVRPASVTVKLLADGKETGKTVELNAANNWSDSFRNLDVYADGEKITYTVSEVSVDGYDSIISGDAETGYVVTNSHETAVTSVSGGKTWADSDDQDGKRPESITIRLLADGVEVDAVKVTEEDGWAWSFDGLDKFADGKEIVYTVTEDAVERYSASYDGYDVVNSYAPEQTSVTVTKAWEDADDQDGVRPESVTVKLLADGVETGKTVELNAANNWTDSFTELDVYADGKAIVYTIAETECEGYEAVITGDAAEGYVVTNIHDVETVDKTVEKKWDDKDNKAGARPESVQIQLLANGEAVEIVVLDEANEWTYTWTDLAVNADGEPIEYTVVELNVAEGYNVDVDVQGDTFVVTNEYFEPEVPTPGEPTPDEPGTPDDSDEPDDSDDPDKTPVLPVKPNDDDEDSTDSTDDDNENAPYTGDNGGLMAWLALAMTSLFGAASIGRRKEEE